MLQAGFLSYSALLTKPLLFNEWYYSQLTLFTVSGAKIQPSKVEK
jgi:hypothetical protein